MGSQHPHADPHLSIHDLTRRSTNRLLPISRLLWSFNSRPHKEVDNSELTSIEIGSVFQFTTSQGGRLCTRRVLRLLRRPFNSRSRYCPPFWHFQFTTSQGGRHSIFPKRSPPSNLSIHDLTRRSTCSLNFLCISSCTFNSRPHKEVVGGVIGAIYKPITFQFTTSQGGRPV